MRVHSVQTRAHNRGGQWESLEYPIELKRLPFHLGGGQRCIASDDYLWFNLLGRIPKCLPT
jgi:hypothetical protein